MNITVFLGSAMGNDPAIREALCEFAAWIGDHGHALIYGGSRIGLMGLLAETAKAHGARVTGIEPRFFVEACVQFDGADELIVTQDMADRKDKLIPHGGCRGGLPRRHGHIGGALAGAVDGEPRAGRAQMRGVQRARLL